MRYEDTEFDPATDADREAAAREAELARKIRREVLRVQRGEADDDLRADREAEQEQKDADGPREHLIGDLDDEGLPAEEETHGNPEDKTTHFHDHEAISPLSLRKS